MRVAGLNAQVTKNLTGLKTGTYNTWMLDPQFVKVHQAIPELSEEYRQEAIVMIRRDNQLQAVLLESEIIKKMREEIATGKYDLIRSNLAKEVYSKLVTDLDLTPRTQNLTWEERILNIFNPKPEGIAYDKRQENVIESAESTESGLLTQGVQELSQDEVKDEVDEIVEDGNNQ